MKRGIIVHRGENIGDFIQSLAAAQFMGKKEDIILLERESLNSYDGEDVEVIMNAWFMRNPNNWPPSNKIHPIFYAFHINAIAKDKLLNSESISYLKKYEPIGCRDYNTVEMLKKGGIDAFYTGCLTLTLGEKYFSKERNNTIYISDLTYPSNSILKINNYITLIKQFVIHPKLLFVISHKLKQKRSYIRKLFDSANIVNTYIKILDKNILFEAEYLNHIIEFDSYENMLKKAEDLIIKYSKARAVITNKIHCALPCLGLKTPVIWIEDLDGDEEYRCRFKGISNLFNRISYQKGKVHILFSDKISKITKDNFPNNPMDYEKIKNDLLSIITSNKNI